MRRHPSIRRMQRSGLAVRCSRGLVLFHRKAAVSAHAYGTGLDPQDCPPKSFDRSASTISSAGARPVGTEPSSAGRWRRACGSVSASRSIFQHTTVGVSKPASASEDDLAAMEPNVVDVGFLVAPVLGQAPVLEPDKLVSRRRAPARAYQRPSRSRRAPYRSQAAAESPAPTPTRTRSATPHRPRDEGSRQVRCPSAGTRGPADLPFAVSISLRRASSSKVARHDRNFDLQVRLLIGRVLPWHWRRPRELRAWPTNCGRSWLFSPTGGKRGPWGIRAVRRTSCASKIWDLRRPWRRPARSGSSRSRFAPRSRPSRKRVPSSERPTRRTPRAATS